MSYATQLLTSKSHFRNDSGKLKYNQKKRPACPDTRGTGPSPPMTVTCGSARPAASLGPQRDTGHRLCLPLRSPAAPRKRARGYKYETAPLTLSAPGFLGRNKPLITLLTALRRHSPDRRQFSAEGCTRWFASDASGFPPGEARIDVSARDTQFANENHKQVERTENMPQNRKNGIRIKHLLTSSHFTTVKQSRWPGWALPARGATSPSDFHWRDAAQHGRALRNHALHTAAGCTGCCQVSELAHPRVDEHSSFLTSTHSSITQNFNFSGGVLRGGSFCFKPPLRVSAGREHP